jgi:probable F420-dependent oxidoreductase
MDFGVVVPTFGPYWGRPGVIRDAIVAAEDAGLRTAWFGDHIVIPQYAQHLSPPCWFDALACSMVGAGLTSRIRFAPDVLVLPYRNPVELSQALASADQLSGGRMTLAVGVGYISGEFEAVGAPPYSDRGAVTDEYLAVLRTLWNGRGPVSYSGRWVSFEDVIPGPLPAQDPLPVLVGGNAAAALRRAALLGDGWHPLFPTPQAYAAGRATIERLRGKQGRSGGFRYSYSCPPCSVQVRAGERPPALHRPDDVPDEYRYAPAFPQDAGGRSLFNGTPEQVIADLRAYQDAGVQEVALRLWAGEPGFELPDWLEQLRRFTEHVLPALGASAPGT